MGKGRIVRDRLLHGEQLIALHAELRCVILSAVVVTTIPLVIPQDHSGNVLLFLAMKKERQHFEVFVPLGN